MILNIQGATKGGLVGRSVVPSTRQRIRALLLSPRINHGRARVIPRIKETIDGGRAMGGRGTRLQVRDFADDRMLTILAIYP